MARYIDREQAIKNAVGALKGVSHITAVDVAIALEETPTADVVPKSDLDLLKSLITHKEEKSYNKGYADAKTSILMDIKAIMEFVILDYKKIGSFDNAEIVGYVRDHLLTELEKRYTEGEE